MLVKRKILQAQPAPDLKIANLQLNTQSTRLTKPASKQGLAIQFRSGIVRGAGQAAKRHPGRHSLNSGTGNANVRSRRSLHVRGSVADLDKISWG